MAETMADPVDGKRKNKKLLREIRDQMEFYFGDANLQKDRFLRKLFEESPDGYIGLEMFLQFNKIRALTLNVDVIAKALKKSTILEVRDGSAVKRMIPPRKLNQQEVDERTIYVEPIPAIADHVYLKKLFTRFGNVAYVSIPKYKTTGAHKGFAFIEFQEKEAAEKAVKSLTAGSGQEFSSSCMFPKTHKELTRLQNALVKQKPDATEEIEEEANPHKRKLDEDDGDAEEPSQSKKTRGEEEEAEKKPKRKRDSEEVFADDQPTSKHFKSDDDDEEDEKEKEGDGGTDGDSPEEEKKRKRRRKKKKSEKEEKEEDPDLMQIRAISKCRWLQLRQEFLSRQKENMSRLKEELKKLRSEQYPSNSEQQDKRSKLEFTPGAIIKFSMETENITKKELKEALSKVADVQFIELDEESQEGYIRCSNADNAKKLLESDGPFQLTKTLLTGDDETKYWEKLHRDREEKLSSSSKTKKKTRGRKKVLEKIDFFVENSAKAAHVHIHFDD